MKKWKITENESVEMELLPEPILEGYEGTLIITEGKKEKVFALNLDKWDKQFRHGTEIKPNELIPVTFKNESDFEKFKKEINMPSNINETYMYCFPGSYTSYEPPEPGGCDVGWFEDNEFKSLL
jgi:hypothetical protein